MMGTCLHTLVRSFSNVNGKQVPIIPGSMSMASPNLLFLPKLALFT